MTAAQNTPMTDPRPDLPGKPPGTVAAPAKGRANAGRTRKGGSAARAGTPATPAAPAVRKPDAKRAAELAKAAAARLAAVPDDRRAKILAGLAACPGYSVIWPKGAWSTLKLTDPAKAAEGAPAWLIMCNAHGTTKTIPGSKAAEEAGRSDQRPGWCKGCAKAAKDEG